MVFAWEERVLTLPFESYACKRRKTRRGGGKDFIFLPNDENKIWKKMR